MLLSLRLASSSLTPFGMIVVSGCHGLPPRGWCRGCVVVAFLLEFYRFLEVRPLEVCFPQADGEGLFIEEEEKGAVMAAAGHISEVEWTLPRGLSSPCHRAGCSHNAIC